MSKVAKSLSNSIKAVSSAAKVINKMMSSSPQAPTKKKKKNSNKKVGLQFDSSDTIMTAPAAARIGTRSKVTSKPFDVPFSSAIVQIATNAGGVTAFTTTGVPATTTGNPVVSISPGTGLLSTVFPVSFAPQILRLGQSFSQYRIKPGSARLSYRGIIGTGASGSLAIAVLPAENPLAIFSTNLPYNTVANHDCAITTPVWAACMEFPPDRLRSVLHTKNDDGWKYLDQDTSGSSASDRQDFCMTLSVSGIGTPLTSVFGVLFLEGIFQFQHVQDNFTEVGLHKQPSSTPMGDILKQMLEIENNKMRDIEDDPIVINHEYSDYKRSQPKTMVITETDEIDALRTFRALRTPTVPTPTPSSS